MPSNARRRRTAAAIIAVLLALDVAGVATAAGRDLPPADVPVAGLIGTLPPPPEPTPPTPVPAEAAPPPPATTAPVAPTPPTPAPPTTRVRARRAASRTPASAPRRRDAAVPAPAPAPADPRDPGTGDLSARVAAALEAAVPESWLAVLRPRTSVISGSTSWASSDGQIKVSTTHARWSWTRLKVVVAHEYGHLIAFRYGTQAYPGAAPEGWPEVGPRPEERWADCAAQAFTGVVDPSHGLPPCPARQLSWTTAWLGQPPASHPVTG